MIILCSLKAEKHGSSYFMVDEKFLEYWLLLGILGLPVLSKSSNIYAYLTDNTSTSMLHNTEISLNCEL